MCGTNALNLNNNNPTQICLLTCKFTPNRAVHSHQYSQPLPASFLFFRISAAGHSSHAGLSVSSFVFFPLPHCLSPSIFCLILFFPLLHYPVNECNRSGYAAEQDTIPGGPLFGPCLFSWSDRYQGMTKTTMSSSSPFRVVLSNLTNRR